MAQIELEYRAIVTEEQYRSLNKFLLVHAEDLGQDDKDTYFFLMPNKMLKVVDNVSADTAKISLKMGRIGHGGYDVEELEYGISRADVSKAVRVFQAIEVGEMMRAYQKRHNYLYKGVELAVKYSDSWKYHVELEILLADRGKLEEAQKQIQSVAKELELKLLSESELRELTLRLEEEYRQKHGAETAD